MMNKSWLRTALVVAVLLLAVRVHGQADFRPCFGPGVPARAMPTILRAVAHWEKQWPRTLVPLSIVFEWDDSLDGSSLAVSKPTYSVRLGWAYASPAVSLTVLEKDPGFPGSLERRTCRFCADAQCEQQGKDMSVLPHVLIRIRPSISWHFDDENGYGTDDWFDLESVVLHELAHGLFLHGSAQRLVSQDKEAHGETSSAPLDAQIFDAQLMTVCGTHELRSLVYSCQWQADQTIERGALTSSNLMYPVRRFVDK
ncbi:hypothetical protein FVE85_5034 [Porphyridium purpureum]|uniref:Uncharacterized protein n=1 Tax=Porphyridium purpureum TaxID=35688 RepID=A0A5J4YG87_PORPP|nr:hypothetical protein FVE85_5034 [Porphyridium purpureum]|eukprot:POR9593..scf237_24